MGHVEKTHGLNRHPGADMLNQWMAVGGRTAFIQDGNSMIMPPQDLIAALTHLRQTFPSIERITTYARARTLAQRSLEDLKAMAAGFCQINIPHMGLHKIE